MIGHNRHNKYRRSVYQRRSVSTIIITVAITLTVCMLAMLIFGNILHSKYQKDNSADSDHSSESNNQQNTDTYLPPENIKAYSVLIETNDSSTFSTRLDSLPESYQKAVSIPLNKKDGSLLYKSDIAKEIGYESEGFSVTLSNVVEKAKEKEIYISGVYYINDFTVEDALLRQVGLARSSAIISEALISGLNEVVIIAPNAKPDNVDEIIRFIDSIKYNSPNGSLGFAVPESIFSIEDDTLCSEKILSLSNNADFLAFNASVIESSDASEEITQMLNNQKFYIHKYKMRVLLPKMSTTDEQASIINAVKNASIDNWQILEY